MKDCQHNWKEIPGSKQRGFCGCNICAMRCTKCGAETDSDFREADAILGVRKETQEVGNEPMRRKGHGKQTA